MKNLNIYYSSGCNANCSQCIAQEMPNSAIQAALEDKTFEYYIRRAITKDTIGLGILGVEPSINKKYFGKFIANILDYSPYIQQITMYTNGQSNTFYTDFIIPVLLYCKTHHRALTMRIQFELDGPQDLHDKHHGNNSFQRCMDNLYYISRFFPYNNSYLKLQVYTKSTLYGEDLENYSPYKWFDFMYNQQADFLNNHYNFWETEEDCIDIRPIITVQIPGDYTAAQGFALKRWISPQTDETLFDIHSQYCLVNEDSKTIDYQGNLYDCCLLKDKEIDLVQLRANFEQRMTALVTAGEAIEQDRDKLFNAISSIYCWGATDEQLDSYIHLLGNGFLL